MNNKFDELTKGMAESVTRRQALKKFSFGIVGMALACFGLVNKTVAADDLNICEWCLTYCKNSGGSTVYCKKVYCRTACGKNR